MACCRYHPDRFGIALCMRCRQVICNECTTQLDGINFCHVCLGELAVRPAPTTQAPRAGQWAVLIMVWLCLLGMLWLTRGSWAP